MSVEIYMKDVSFLKIVLNPRVKQFKIEAGFYLEELYFVDDNVEIME